MGHGGITDHNYNDFLFSRIRPEGLNILTIHAEVEGMVRRPLFASFIARAQALGITFVPLGRLLGGRSAIGTAAIAAKAFPGREGWISCQTGHMV